MSVSTVVTLQALELPPGTTRLKRRVRESFFQGIYGTHTAVHTFIIDITSSDIHGYMYSLFFVLSLHAYVHLSFIFCSPYETVQKGVIAAVAGDTVVLMQGGVFKGTGNVNILVQKQVGVITF